MHAKEALFAVFLLVGCTRETPPAPSATPVAPERPALASQGINPRARETEERTKVEAPKPEAAEPAPEPPYDLAADRERRAKVAKEELGKSTITTVVSDIFVVIGPPGWQGAAFDSSVALMKNSMAGYMNGRFGKKPDRAISVYLFADATSYERFCRAKYEAPCIAHYGFYQPSDRYMVMNAGLGLGTLTHEIVHPLVETDFPRAPTWINEGIASVFEAPVIPKQGEIHGVKNWRHPRLKRALQSASERDQVRLDVVFGMPDATFRAQHEDLHYSMARYICQWLDERGKLWPFYQRWRDTVATDPTGEKAFREIVGMTPAEAHVPWSKWALAL